MRVDEKTNEHKAALELLRTLVMKGRVLVGDAMFCQREVCQAVLDSGGDYFLQVKDNQPTLLREIQQELTSSDAVFSPLRTARAAV
jgi:predicted transposase YbfD/YdcC